MITVHAIELLQSLLSLANLSSDPQNPENFPQALGSYQMFPRGHAQLPSLSHLT
jgi:hypothetical protein